MPLHTEHARLLLSLPLFCPVWSHTCRQDQVGGVGLRLFVCANSTFFCGVCVCVCVCVRACVCVCVC